MMNATKKEMATLAGYTYRRLYDIDRDLPANKKLFVPCEEGKYDLAMFVQRWVDYNVNNEAAEDADLDMQKAIHEKIKTRKTELEVARMEGQLVDVTDVQKLWGDIAANVMKNMIRLPNQIAPQLVMMSSSESIAAIIGDAIRETLNQLSETPIPDYARTDGEGDEGEEDG